MPPGVRGTAVSESEDYEGDSSDEEEEDEEEALLRRSRRRGRAEGRRSGRLARRRSPSDPPVRSRPPQVQQSRASVTETGLWQTAPYIMPASYLGHLLGLHDCLHRLCTLRRP